MQIDASDRLIYYLSIGVFRRNLCSCTKKYPLGLFNEKLSWNKTNITSLYTIIQVKHEYKMHTILNCAPLLNF